MEWTIVTVIVVLIGLVAAIVKPLIKLNTTLTKLTYTVDTLEKSTSGFLKNNSDAHKRLWDHSDEQDTILEDHEKRIFKMEVVTNQTEGRNKK